MAKLLAKITTFVADKGNNDDTFNKTDEKVVFIYAKSSVCGGEKRLTTTIKA
jgi:hypothetical protein